MAAAAVVFGLCDLGWGSVHIVENLVDTPFPTVAVERT